MLDAGDVTATVHRQMCTLWPQLRPFRVTHTWKGLGRFTLTSDPPFQP